MKLTWNDCFRAGVTVLLLFLAITYWQSAMNILGLFVSAAAPLLIGCLIAYITNILMSFYESRIAAAGSSRKWLQVRRPVCILLAFLSAVLVIYLIFAMIIPQLVSCFGVLASALPDAMNAAYEWLDERFEISALVNEWSLTLPQSKEEWGALIQKIAKPILAGMGGVMTAAVSMTSSVIGNIVTFFMALLFAVHLLLNKEKLQGQFKRLFEKLLGRRINGACHVLNVANKSFRGYIVGQCIEALILGTLCALGMLILRLPYALMIGALVGVLALIPIAGAYIAAAIGAIMIFSVSPVKAVIFLIFLVILQQIEGNLIYPHTVGSTLQLPGIWVLAAVLIGGGVMGIPGMMISVPLMATAYQLLKQWVNSDRVLPCRRSMEG